MPNPLRLVQLMLDCIWRLFDRWSFSGVLQEEETAKQKGQDGETTGTETLPVGEG